MGLDQPAVRVADHDGDAALEIDAGDEAGCLRGAVRGLASLAGAPTAAAGGAGDPAAAPRRVRIHGATPVERLVALIDHVIAVIDVDGLVAVDAEVAVAPDHADADLALAPIDPGAVAAPPKAATWHSATCGPAGDGRWRARVLIDR